ncbi:MAG TPA: MBL fold metallo-hydrolase [Opitutaceae bacterium]|nr:MBL fold metallo-hydrolase [Opitutaceae bacterium]
MHARLLFALLATATLRLPAGAVDGTLDFIWVDVEGGAATLIVTPAGESILIDSGNPGGRDSGRIVAAARAAGLERIDHHIVTHFHGDHFGGSAEVSAQLPIAHIHDNGVPELHPDSRSADPRWPLLIKPYRDIPAQRHVVAPGAEIALKQRPGAPKLVLRCLAARQQAVAAPAGAPPNPLAAQLRTKEIRPTDNDNSNVFVLEFGHFRFLNAGDLTWNFEGALVAPVNRLGQVDVYQTTHHGREDSNNTVFIHSLAPTVSVMNNGILKGAMTDAIEGLKSSPGIQAMYQVHKNHRPGEAHNNTADEFIANHGTDPNGCAAHAITLSVAPDARTYTVAIPASGHARRFETRKKQAPRDGPHHRPPTADPAG